MRIAVAALCVLALTGSADANDATYCQHTHSLDNVPLAFRGEPAVEWRVFTVPAGDLRRVCSYTGPRVVHSCTYPTDSGYWAVVIAGNISRAEYACRLAYEKAHMPPYFWADPKVEQPETFARLLAQKADYFKRQNANVSH